MSLVPIHDCSGARGSYFAEATKDGATCPTLRREAPYMVAAGFMLLPSLAIANTNVTVMSADNVPGVVGSLLRMGAAFVFVLALLFGGVWLFRNWQRVARRRGHRRLRLVEAQSLGPRQAVYIVGYRQQRFLIGASPSGMSLLSTLPDAAESEVEPELNGQAATFAAVLQQALGRK